ncbi:hypothetical protein BGW36DRAFT_39070 [Talaromyces proteolyticus]|uniref:Uncharacterized protein n=1 Tax=Talaromyces proteolyticus TaxID=1131652 RepID=A0AAD4KME6_9EURO|nr:uncharacterized protein BGW36DRAFT_39070 [Talaromyces proteolyticus]KAH8691862.1 hypothetical protein BGW36DRAFT_39070 [Talaromyces proteolyticus]
MMTFFQQGFVILPWGQPPPEVIREVDEAIRTEMPSNEYYIAGIFNSELSKVLIKFMMYNISTEKNEYIYYSLLGGRNLEEMLLGEPILVDCSKVSDPPQLCRLGPYGYDKGEAVNLLRKIRGTVRIPYYSGSQKLDMFQFQEIRHDERHLPLELTLGDIICVDSDLCIDWPLLDSDGIFVLMTVARGDPQLGIQRDRRSMPVAPFHSTTEIRILEERSGYPRRQ